MLKKIFLGKEEVTSSNLVIGSSVFKLKPNKHDTLRFVYNQKHKNAQFSTSVPAT